ncbi:large conductance mechanosensitive channel protein MscL [Planctomicrobium sp. SH527]|uniref:large conductance mechanosensitive channel protein MscL n=1 Tax=Planctomicrobium sp. SH527 TaxID=3448123 RepID=UPI003F5C255F
MLDEFKAFAFKGNVVDLAVGVIIGGAFGGIVSSLVKNIIMPLISSVTPQTGGYEKWAPAFNGHPIPVGLFLADVLNFVIVAFALFIFIKKFLGWIMKSRTEAPKEPEAPAPLTKDQELLIQIRDLLTQQAKH